MKIDTSVQYLKGVGEKRAKNYTKLGISTVEHLLYHFPRNYLDLSSPYSVSSAPLYEQAAIRARLVYKSGEQRIRKGLSIFKLRAEDNTGVLHITIFNAKFTVQNLKLDNEYIFYGRVEGSFIAKSMASPDIYPAKQKNSILPIYRLTAGIPMGLVRNNVRQILHELLPLPESLSDDIRIKYNIGGINESLVNIHFPQSLEAAKVAQNRLIFQELLTLSCSLFFLRNEKEQLSIDPLKEINLDPFYNSLPFTPTNAQFRCIDDAVGDMSSDFPMNRLIQGDVGSGKTLIAAACMYFAFKNGVQSALMVPTEILAEQHFSTLTDLLSEFGINVRLLTGSTKTAEKREILAGLSDGSIHICVGTHALLSDTIEFNNLGLVITDEQHRFGVSQRATLSQKSENVHVLVMSATPIPRTLSLIIYGDLSLSILDELPPGRQHIDTFVINSSIRQRALGFVKKHLDEGKQAYIVCPLIEAGEIDMGLKPATDYFEDLSQNELRDYSIGLLHGKMSSKQKEETMRKFKTGEIQALVSTTVVEVGVDVPNATIIMIENAERFGLSQLHQLRGRVGRGKEKSYCILVSDAKGEVARKRLNAMKNIDDGFKLAEYDLQLRGPGDFFGYRQHGLPDLKIADLSEDIDIMQKAQTCANEIMEIDPLLETKEFSVLKRDVDKMLKAVGDRPN